MPVVNGKHYGYDKKGMAMARAAAAKAGKPMRQMPAAAGSRTGPSSKASPMATTNKGRTTSAARNKMQQGMAKRNTKAAGRGRQG